MQFTLSLQNRSDLSNPEPAIATQSQRRIMSQSHSL